MARRQLVLLVAVVLLACAVSAKKKEQAATPSKTLHVIGAGWTGSGSDVLAKALDVLGLGPTYHVGELLSGRAKGHVEKWIDHADGRSAIDWKEFFANYSSVVDFPAAVYYKELAAAFPEAKVVLTHVAGSQWALRARQGPFKHHLSWPRRVLGAVFGGERAWDAMNEKTQGPLFKGFRHGRPLAAEDDLAAIKVLKEWEAGVAAAAGAERLLLWDPASGWEPLCSFLGVPVPESGVPAGGSEEEWQWAINVDLAKACGLLGGAALLLLALGAAVGYDYGWAHARKHFGVTRKRH